MSEPVLLEAVRDVIRIKLNLEPHSCDIEVNGQPPPPRCPEYYFAVWPAYWKPGPSGAGGAFDEELGVNVTVSKRSNRVPTDRRRVFLENIHVNYAALVRQVAVEVHNARIDIMVRANARLLVPNRFCEPLRWVNSDPSPREVGPEWFHSEDYSTLVAGHSWTVYFGMARRVQTELTPLLE